jgi:Na+/H+ antiporter NhaD/arsenite permease-like protein
MQPSEIAAGAGHLSRLIWAAPFLGVLASIAVLPAIAPRFWYHRTGWVVAFWSLALLVPEAVVFGPAVAAAGAWRAILVEYLPFVTLLLALFTAGGGVLVRGGVSGTPAGNTALLAVGTLLAGVMGTTGAAMVLIHPLLRANAHRRQKMHLTLVFILLVANAGGALSPLGDPPLYLGFLRGVPFFWPIRHLGAPMALLVALVLAVFWPLDAALARRDAPPPPRERLRIRGWGNALLVLLVAMTVLVLGSVDLGRMSIAGQEIATRRLISVGVFLAITVASAWLTPRSIHQGNDFSWHPMIEVALLFAAIFITIEPVLHMLEEGMQGPFAPLLRLLTDARGNPLPMAYFWLTGGISAFLDNAPTYLVFFELAGIRPETLNSVRSVELEAISAGAVFFGALTYIGNAPNMMVRAIAAHRGVRMPGFFGFMAMAATVLIPVFAVLTAVFFRQ